MALTKVRVIDAVGMILAHDITKIVPGEYKGPLFKKGHIVREEDIPQLLDVGKEYLYLLELAADDIHEDEAGRRIAQAVAGENVLTAPQAEGRTNLVAVCDGLLKVDRHAVDAINNLEMVVLSTLQTNMLVKAGQVLAAAKIIPLVIHQQRIQTIEEFAQKFPPVIAVKPIRQLKIGLVITGNEIASGRIKDQFAPVIAAKAAQVGSTLMGSCILPDDCTQITAAIKDFQQQGAQLIIATGGMSVDPDDVTPEAIRATGAQVVTYGTPVLPGAMFMLAYLGTTVVMGLPSCGMFAKTTVFDLIFPRILAGDILTREDITKMGYGGLCTSCKQCSFPHCPFGKQ